MAFHIRDRCISLPRVRNDLMNTCRVDFYLRSRSAQVTIAYVCRRMYTCVNFGHVRNCACIGTCLCFRSYAIVYNKLLRWYNCEYVYFTSYKNTHTRTCFNFVHVRLQHTAYLYVETSKFARKPECRIAQENRGHSRA